ncbi:TPA: hypothetical protein ACPWGP_004589 [Pseudomonas aeruginosa]|nr:hypothetical protein [Pseudomonas aeruginosa]HEP8062229.1 hypothetical protein [Pseudomonas aeruginosa]
MNLTDFEIPTESILINPGCKPGDEFYLSVRGLSASDFAVLINEHEDIMRWLFEGANLNDEAQLMNQLFVRSVQFLALVIALAAEQQDQAYKIVCLPPMVQINLVKAVTRLTMPEGLKKSVQEIKLVISLLLKEFKSLSGKEEQAEESKKNRK